MLELKNIVVRREERNILAIDALNIQPNEFTVILGHNGSGKSTLMRLLARQLRPDSGNIKLFEKSIDNYSQRQLAQQIAYLPQHLPDVAGLTVRELVRLGRFPWRGSFARWRPDDQQIITAAMADTDISGFSEHMADELSGGERQRAWVAMLLAQQSPLLLLDEPTSALDPAHQYELMALLARLNQGQARGVVVILHDINLALRYAQRIIALKHGRIIFDDRAQALLSPELLKTLFGIDMQIIEHENLTAPLVAMR